MDRAGALYAGKLPTEQFLVSELRDADELDPATQNHDRDLATAGGSTHVLDGFVISSAIVMNEFDDSTGGRSGFELIEEICRRLL